MSKRNPHPEDKRGRPSHKRVAADANAWADKLRAERARREATTQPAPVVVPPKL